MKIAESVEMVEVGSLKSHPENPRIGDIASILASIKKSGFYGTLLVQRGTGYICAGNHRFKAGVKAGIQKFPVQWIDCTAEESLKILLADNKASDVSFFNEGAVASILASLDDAAGTGYSPSDVNALLGSMSDGGQGEKPPADKVSASVMMRIGDGQIQIPNKEFSRWLKGIKRKVGMSHKAVKQEIMRRVNELLK